MRHTLESRLSTAANQKRASTYTSHGGPAADGCNFRTFPVLPKLEPIASCGKPVASFHKSQENSSAQWHGLPEATNGRSLVGNDQNYTKYSTSGVRLKVVANGESPRYKSLPNTGAGNPRRMSRHTSSAPNAQKFHRESTRPSVKGPTQINNLMCGANDNRPSSGVAGVPTRPPNVGRASTKFASAWADARVEHIIRNPGPRQDNSPGRRKDGYASDETHAKSKPSVAGRFHNPDNPNSAPAPHERSKHKQHKSKSLSVASPRPASSEPSSDNREIKPKSILKSSNSEGTVTVKPLARSRTTFVAPTRLKRERSKIMKRHKSFKDGLPIRKSSKAKDTDVYTIDDAAKIYYADVLREQSTLEHEGPPEGGRSTATPDSQTESHKTSHVESAATEQQKPYVLTKRESQIYKQINSVYGTGTTKHRKNRQNDFFKKLEDLQLEEWKRKQRDYKKQQVKKKESKDKQKRQLKQVRDKFEEEQVKRFQSQYVTSKILEHEWVTRQRYGLPDDLNEEPEYEAKLKPKTKKPKGKVDTQELRKKNSRVFNNMFEMNLGPRWDPHAKEPLMDGVDTVTIKDADGKGGKKKVDVKEVVGDAQKMLEGILEAESDLDDDGQGRSSGFDADDDDDADFELEGDEAFSRAMAKYGITLDSDED